MAGGKGTASCPLGQEALANWHVRPHPTADAVCVRRTWLDPRANTPSDAHRRGRLLRGRADGARAHDADTAGVHVVAPERDSARRAAADSSPPLAVSAAGRTARASAGRAAQRDPAR